MPDDFVASVCPHDCPSACALEVERLGPAEIGRVRGAAAHPYTDGVICAKVQRYRERVHHPDRLTVPLRRVGPKGAGAFEPIAWDAALDLAADRFRDASRTHGPETVWPYYYSGNMGQVQQKSILRLRRLMGYSRMARTICSSVAKAGFKAGTGALRGADAREIAESDLVVIWGTNAVATQIHVMELARRARNERGARIVVVDTYRTRTAALADLHLMPRPGTDGALACAVMHVLFAEGMVDRAYMDRYTSGGERLEAHLRTRTPAWASDITGIAETDIVAFARLYGTIRRSFLRLGMGFTRHRNGAVNMHAASCLPALTGAWTERGGGALCMSGDVFDLDTSPVEAGDAPPDGARTLDMSRIGDVLAGDREALCGGPPVTAMLIQNCNPAAVAPNSERVRAGLARDDLFLCVHEQFMTDTARLADLVLPATTFLENDDLFTSYGHTFLQATRPVIPPLGESRCNHDVINDLAKRLGAAHRSLDTSAHEMVAATLRASGLDVDPARLADGQWVDCQVPFETAHFLDGFAHPDGRFRFAPDWAEVGPDHAGLPVLPDHVPSIEEPSPAAPFRLVTAPARNFLNTSFTETPTSRKAEKQRPAVLVHPEDAASLGLAEGDAVRLGNERGDVVAHLRAFDGLHRGVVVVESIWPNTAFAGGRGINTLTGADPVAPAGGAAFHDTAVWMEPA